LAGVVLNGLPGNPVTNAAGQYTSIVNYNWSGTATPGLAGYTFTPAGRNYNNITSNQSGQNYTATAVPAYTVSGTITYNGNPLAGVALTGLPGNPTTNAAGQYSAAVNQGFSGTVTPGMTGYTFNPANRSYNNVTANQTGQDYTASTVSYTISGTITYNGAGLANVVLTGLPGNPTTNASGQYTASANSGWSGMATPTLSGYSFTPGQRTYAAGLIVSQTGQDYAAGAGGAGDDPAEEEKGGGGGGCFIGSAPKAGLWEGLFRFLKTAFN